MIVTLGQQYNVGQKPTVIIMYLASIAIVVSHIQRIGCQPEKNYLHGGQPRSWSAEQGNVYNSSAHALPIAFSFLCMVNTFSRV